jgi:hypothetical protein
MIGKKSFYRRDKMCGSDCKKLVLTLTISFSSAETAVMCPSISSSPSLSRIITNSFSVLCQALNALALA